MTIHSATQVIHCPKFVEHCILRKNMTVGINLEISEEKGLAYVQPCAAEVGKVMLESDLTKLIKPVSDQIIDFNVLCDLLNAYKIRFSEFRCSLALGVSKIRWRGKTVSIFKKGKIKIREALNKEDALKSFQDFLRLIWGSFICEVCGKPAICCAAGLCNKCQEKNGEKNHVNLEDLPTGIMLSNALIDLTNIFPMLDTVFSNILNGINGTKISEIKVGNFERKLNRINIVVLDFMLQTPDIKQAVLGFIPLGITLNLKHVLLIINSLIKEINQNLDILIRFNTNAKDCLSGIFQETKSLYELIPQTISTDSNVHENVKKIGKILEKIKELEKGINNMSGEFKSFILRLVKYANEICLAGLRILNILGVEVFQCQI